METIGSMSNGSKGGMKLRGIIPNKSRTQGSLIPTYLIPAFESRPWSDSKTQTRSRLLGDNVNPKPTPLGPLLYGS